MTTTATPSTTPSTTPAAPRRWRGASVPTQVLVLTDRSLRALATDPRVVIFSVLQPLVMGRAVSIHPLAVVLGISTGAVLAGIVGALLAVPIIAFINSAVRVLFDRVDEHGHPEAGSGDQLISAEPDKPPGDASPQPA